MKFSLLKNYLYEFWRRFVFAFCFFVWIAILTAEQAGIFKVFFICGGSSKVFGKMVG